MNSKIVVVGALVVVVAIIAVAFISFDTDDTKDDSEATIVFEDALGRTISFSEAPERVAIVNTDLAYYMEILGLHDKIVGMDSDGLERMLKYSDHYDDVKDIGKRGAFSSSTSIELMKMYGVTCVITPTTMGLGNTVLADVIENNGITVVYLNAYGADMLTYLDKMVVMFGGGPEISSNAEAYKKVFNDNENAAKKIVSPDIGDYFTIYMASSSGTLGNYYKSSSEISGIVTSISGTNSAQSDSGSFSQYTGESLCALFYDGTEPKLDYLIIRGTDDYTIDEVMTIYGNQQLYSGYTVEDYARDYDIPIVFINTHLASGVMCYISYYIYAYMFEGTLSEHISEIDALSQDFLDKYDLDFSIDEEHPSVTMIDY